MDGIKKNKLGTLAVFLDCFPFDIKPSRLMSD